MCNVKVSNLNSCSALSGFVATFYFILVFGPQTQLSSTLFPDTAGSDKHADAAST